MLAAGGRDGDRQADVFAARAVALSDAGRVQKRVVALRQRCHLQKKVIRLEPHDLDREQAGVFDQRIFAMVWGGAILAVGRRGHGRCHGQ